MPPLPSRGTSTKIADVLRVVHSPCTPEAAKQQTLRRLDGLEGRHAPVPKRRSLDRAHGDVHSDPAATAAVAVAIVTDSETRCRLGVSTGVAPLSPPDGSTPEDRSRSRSANIEAERRALHVGSSCSAPPRSPSSGRRRVIFMDEWGVAGQENFFHESARPDGISTE